eukprot:132907-Amphidinium_carterae.1
MNKASASDLEGQRSMEWKVHRCDLEGQRSMDWKLQCCDLGGQRSMEGEKLQGTDSPCSACR